ncbi:peptidylprolyl isomerase [Acetivibrio cellulolyticus]|uniref:peptidylprolyl isomerase n=1 Tax=Acetivibrio cellulolyticus TaxID=35830 RepID=UPI0001E2C205|nr:peptidylprolyl isomerase [Acetivibrio cellulolyticus]
MNLKKVITFALSASLVFSLSACNKSVKLSNGKNSTDIVGTVGDEKITATEFKFYATMEINQKESQAGIADKSKDEKKKYWETKEGDVDRKQTVIDNTLNNLTELKVLLMSAKKDNVKLEQTDFDDANKMIDQFVQNEAKGDKNEAEKVMMEKYGVSIDQYKLMYQDYMLAYNKYASSQPAKIEINDSDVKSEFEKNKEQYNKVTVKHVLVLTNDSTTNEPLPEDKVAEKKKLADDILKKAQAGEDFEALVKQYSEDPGSKDKGGEYTFPKGEMVKEFEDWAFNAKEGDMGVVQTTYGFHVMKFIKREDASFDAEKDKLKSSLQNAQYQKKLDELKKANPVVKDQKVIDSLDLF